jgi:hypothetical protein
MVGESSRERVVVLGVNGESETDDARIGHENIIERKLIWGLRVVILRINKSVHVFFMNTLLLRTGKQAFRRYVPADGGMTQRRNGEIAYLSWNIPCSHIIA